MSAHIEGAVACDWCEEHLIPVSWGWGRFQHVIRERVPEQKGPYCPHEGKFYKVNWQTHTVEEVK